LQPQLCADRGNAQCPIVDGPSSCALLVARACFQARSVHQSAEFGSHSKIDISPGPRTVLLLTDTLWPMSRLLTILVVILFTLIYPCSGVDLAVRDAVLSTRCNSLIHVSHSKIHVRARDCGNILGLQLQAKMVKSSWQLDAASLANIFADCGFVFVTSGCVFQGNKRAKWGASKFHSAHSIG